MENEELKRILGKYEPISLAELDAELLMDRVDQKFGFNRVQLPELLEALSDDYRVLEVADTRMTHYETLYYDTPQFDLFHQHHNGKANRYKIRLRRYVESDTRFFEVKYKNNKGRTIKTRVPRTDKDETITGNSGDFFKDTTGMEPASMEPKLWVNYLRITLVNKKVAERVTIDLDMEMKNGDGSCAFEGVVIVEVKQEKIGDTKILRTLRKMHIREGGTSKYCIAVSKLVGDVKKNNFKTAIHSIDKITNDKNDH